LTSSDSDKQRPPRGGHLPCADRAESTLWLSEFSPNGLYHRSPRRKHAQSCPPPAINRRLAVDENLELAVGSTDQFNVSV